MAKEQQESAEQTETKPDDLTSKNEPKDESRYELNSAEEEESSEEEPEPKRRKPAPRGDVKDGCTLFLTQIPQTLEEREIKNFFKSFGEVKYFSKLVNPNTELSMRKGFLRFVDRDSLEKCFEEATKNKQ